MLSKPVTVSMFDKFLTYGRNMKKLFTSNFMNIRVGNYDIKVPQGHIYTHSGLPPEYDYFPLALIMESIKGINNAHFIDIGANVGDTLAHVKSHNTDIEVTCIEPSEYFYSFLEKNAENFANTSLINKFVTPKNLRDKIKFQSANQTGTTEVVDSNDADNIDPAKFIDLEDIIKKNRANIVKTDTDGFDLHILSDIVSILRKNSYDVPMIFFEGPTEQNFHNFLIEDWFPVFSSLTELSYNLLIIQNNGLPYVNVGMNANAAKSAMCSLHMGFANGRPQCHYFDVIAYRSQLDNAYLSLETPWPQIWKKH